MNDRCDWLVKCPTLSLFAVIHKQHRREWRSACVCSKVHINTLLILYTVKIKSEARPLFSFFVFSHKDADGRLQIYFSSGQRTLWEGNLKFSKKKISLKLIMFDQNVAVLCSSSVVLFLSRSCWQSLRRQENCTPSKPWRKKTLWLGMRWTGECKRTGLHKSSAVNSYIAVHLRLQ